MSAVKDAYATFDGTAAREKFREARPAFGRADRVAGRCGACETCLASRALDSMLSFQKPGSYEVLGERAAPCKRPIP